ncbi:MAG TPA: 16S rRNA (guanine(527)-N(7))-methyltransferase RsmG [Candidatus Limnocylindrales bacterium]|nr:16S rRNA (guanine(527)-N(7))-methyltransferase RsmG [Candidatus Limnocylindrales bacterium]
MDREAQYAALLLDWRQRVNLTGARTLAELEPHLKDAHGLLEISWAGVTRAIDIGSGGGLPAIPLALALPGVRFTLLEASRRKVAFLQHVAGELRLDNVEVVDRRAEEAGRLPGYREAFDRAVSRAAARPAVLLELAVPFIRTGGDLVADVGAIDAAPLAPVAARLGASPPWIERTRAGQSVLRLRKLSPTPPEYPRRPGVPERRPLA